LRKEKEGKAARRCTPYAAFWKFFSDSKYTKTADLLCFAGATILQPCKIFQDQNAATKTVSFGTTFSFRKEKVDVSLL
jgi:hypothetical protein